MHKHLLMMLAINQTSALPIGIRIDCLNSGLFNAKKLSDVPALMSLINYTLFKYSTYEREELEDIETLLDEHDFKVRFDTWSITEDSFYFLGFKEVTGSEFDKLQKLDLLTVVDENNYQNEFLSTNGEHKFDHYFKDFNESKEQEILQQYKKIVFNLKSNIKLNTEFQYDAFEVLSSYHFGTAMQEVNTTSNEFNHRTWFKHTLEKDFMNYTIKFVFTNFKNVDIKDQSKNIEVVNVEIIAKYDECLDDDYFILMQRCEYVIDMIKADLYANTHQ